MDNFVRRFGRGNVQHRHNVDGDHSTPRCKYIDVLGKFVVKVPVLLGPDVRDNRIHRFHPNSRCVHHILFVRDCIDHRKSIRLRDNHGRHQYLRDCRCQLNNFFLQI